MQINIDFEQIKLEVEQQLIENIKSKLILNADHIVHSSYDLGYRIKQTLTEYINNNLEAVVLEAIQKVDIQEKVDKAIERKVLDIVHKHLKNI